MGSTNRKEAERPSELMKMLAEVKKERDELLSKNRLLEIRIEEA